MEALALFEPEKTPEELSREKDFEQDRELDEWDARETPHPSTPMAKTGKRKSADDRQPESPPEIERQLAPSNWHREKHFRSHVSSMDTDSPASYAKHNMAGDQPPYRVYQPYHEDSPSKGSVSTPRLTSEEPSGYGSYEHPSYRPTNYYQGHQDNGYYQNHTPPRQTQGHYPNEVDGQQPNYVSPPNDGYMRPRRWACDYCNTATFVSYEEACSHEEACARRYHERFGGRPHPSHGPVPQYDQQPHAHHAHPRGLGALYHAGQEVGPSMRQQQMWNTRGPPMPHLPHEHHGAPLYPSVHHGHQSHGYHNPQRYAGYHGYSGERQHHDYQPSQKRMLLAMPTDSDSLSDRQCYVRTEMVEIFAATNKDVSSRHSKGAQKLIEGQVGIRCVHCAHLRPRDRAERAVCYPSSISRIYQTVADMQRFHFEQCREIPAETRKIYKSLKTTRPRGVGSPQTYWVQSAKLLDLVDTEQGIRFSNDMKASETTTSTPAN